MRAQKFRLCNDWSAPNLYIAGLAKPGAAATERGTLPGPHTRGESWDAMHPIVVGPMALAWLEDSHFEPRRSAYRAG